MLNKIWGIFIIISISYGFVSGNIEYVNNSLFESIKTTTSFIIELTGNLCFWNGIINILKNTSLINKIKKIIRPIINMIFPEIKEKDEEYEDISTNIISNLIGIGNAATTSGISAMKKMQNKNLHKNKLTPTMIKFILINTASIQLIPTTLISIRTSLGSNRPSCIILAIWFSSIVSFISIIIISKIYLRFFKK